jgi:uroporphyrinogen III methyltransferase/synthase
MSIGRVALVGAGPGDPALLTLRAAELLRVAEVVAYDELVSEAILALVPETAELLPVGRRAGKGHLAYRIHPDVLDRASRGLFVVRLKAGDPLVFGRGGEEAEELASRGIPFEIVPGVSAALGAAAYSAIPLTHRDLSAQVVISTGHRSNGGAPPPSVVGGRTLALYMASHDLEANLAGIVAAGWAPSTPAALVIAATTADEHTITGTLATLAARAAGAIVPGSKLPSLVFVGEVVGLRGGIDWRAHLPLRGRRIIVARARAGASSVARALRTLGGEVIELPHVERDLIDAPGALRKELGRIDYGAILVGCDEGADALGEAGLRPGHPDVLAIGATIATRLRAHGVEVAATLRGACAEALAAAQERLRGADVLVPVADRFRPNLEAEMVRMGARPRFVAVAHDRHVGPAHWPSRVDLVVLPASSAARALYANAPLHVRQAASVAMGARTLEEAHRCGAPHVTCAERDTVEGLVLAAVRAVSGARPGAASSGAAAISQEVTP